MKTLDVLFYCEKRTAYAMQFWFEYCCALTPRRSEAAATLWDSWIHFAQTQEFYPATKKKLGMFLRFQGFQALRLQSGTRCVWRGLSLLKTPNETASIRWFLREDHSHFVVDARAFHKTLRVKSDFSTWIKNRINQSRFQADCDYQRRDDPALGQRVDYRLSLSMGLELCLIDGTNTGLAVHSQLQDYCDQLRQKPITLGVTP